MSKTKIGWCDYTINPVRGLCPVGCTYCYARRHYQRFHLFKDGTPNPAWDYKIRYMPIDWVNREIDRIDNRRGAAGENARIFIGSTMELFGGWIDKDYMRQIFSLVAGWPEHTFIFLTKRPGNLIKYSPFPKNCWVGISVTNQKDVEERLIPLERIRASVRFVSVEPMAGEIDFKLGIAYLSWVIIGAQTPASAKTAPKVEWIKEIVEAADTAGIKVWLKENLYRTVNPAGHWNEPFYMEVAGYGRCLRQEFPKVSSPTREVSVG